jgi:GNAT superfamily N-acetyltransferase
VIQQVDWVHPDAEALREARRREIAVAYGRECSEPVGSEATGADMVVFLVAYEGDRAVGCGGLRLIGSGAGEIKRMYVVPDRRGTGVSTAVLKALEAWAVEHHIRVLRLETGDLLVAAQRFYEREGYSPIPPFGPYIGSDLSCCYEKELTAVEPTG